MYKKMGITTAVYAEERNGDVRAYNKVAGWGVQL